MGDAKSYFTENTARHYLSRSFRGPGLISYFIPKFTLLLAALFTFTRIFSTSGAVGRHF